MVDIGNALGLIGANVNYFLRLTLEPDVFWNVLPLILCTIFIIAYFTRYKDERAGWNSYLGNSLVLIFVAMNLFRYVYNLDIPSPHNYLNYPAKSISVLLLLSLGLLFVRFNFSHLLPERYARIVSSPLSINLIAYAVILHVYSAIQGSWWAVILALLVIVFVLGAIIEVSKIPIKWVVAIMEKEQEKDRFRNIREAKFEIDELERELKARRRELEYINLKKLEREKKTVTKLEREVKKR